MNTHRRCPYDHHHTTYDDDNDNNTVTNTNNINTNNDTKTLHPTTITNTTVNATTFFMNRPLTSLFQRPCHGRFRILERSLPRRRHSRHQHAHVRRFRFNYTKPRGNFFSLFRRAAYHFRSI